MFCAMGITAEEYNFFRSDLERTGALENAVLFVNLADDPAVERIITPRLARPPPNTWRLRRTTTSLSFTRT